MGEVRAFNAGVISEQTSRLSVVFFQEVFSPLTTLLLAGTSR